MDASAILSKMKNHERVRGSDVKFGAVGSYATVEKAETTDGATEIVAVATTDDIDLDDEVVLPSGLDKSYILRNRQVFMDHNYDMSSVAGMIRSIGAFPSPQDQRGWRVRIRLNTSEAGLLVEKIAREHGQIGLSIGFLPTEIGPPTDDERTRLTRDGKSPASVVRAGEWFELSFTALPCNVSAQGQVSEGDSSKILHAVRGLVDRGEVKRSAAMLFGVGGGYRLNIQTGEIDRADE